MVGFTFFYADLVLPPSGVNVVADRCKQTTEIIFTYFSMLL